MASKSEQSIASTILDQLGGTQFIAMTGAKNILNLGNGFQFGLPGKLKQGINKVIIILEPTDTYSVAFWKIHGVNMKQIKAVDMVYADSLRRVFTETTGLNCVLFGGN